jgi:hypothetical protein
MSTTRRPATRASGAPPARYRPEGSGWVLFSAIVLTLLATLNLIDGVAAVSSSTFFVAGAKLVVSDVKSWGWFLIIVGLFQGIAAFGVFLRWRGWRWVGVSVAGVNSVMQLVFMPAYPLWAICLFALDMLVMYGLVLYGGPQDY